MTQEPAGNILKVDIPVSILVFHPCRDELRGSHLLDLLCIEVVVILRVKAARKSFWTSRDAAKVKVGREDLETGRVEFAFGSVALDTGFDAPVREMELVVMTCEGEGEEYSVKGFEGW